MKRGARNPARLGAIASITALAALLVPGSILADPAAAPTPDPQRPNSPPDGFDDSTAPEPDAARWLEEVGPLITPAERAAFLALQHPYQRSAFELKFWE